MLLLQALRAVMPAPRFLLATALPVDPSVLGRLDLCAVSGLVNHINLMCYDFTGPWSETAGHQAQLFSHQHAPHQPSAQSGVQYLLDRGVPPQRILLGIPAYARVFLGARGEGDAFQKDVEECGNDEEKEEVEIDYRDVPSEWKQQLQVDHSRAAAWAVVPRPEGKGGHSFASLDVPATVRAKADFVRQTGLGGLFYWTGAGDCNGDGESLVAAGFDALHRY